MYTVLNNALQVKGKLSLNNGQGSTAFFSDVITQQMATDNSTDPDSMTSLAFNATDKVGNTKQWGHSLSINVEATDLGTSISTNDYLMYFDKVANHYYLMKVLTVGGDRTTGYLAIDGINTTIYELGKQFPVAKTYTQANLETVVKDVYKNVPFSIRIEDDLETVIDYTIAEKTSAQAILQDLQTKYDVDADSWIELDNSGNISERVLYFGHLGANNGELIRYGGAKGFENMSSQEVSDTIYTKLYVVGQTDDKDATKGHISSVNNGMDYIVDDEANASLYAIGASQNQPNYLEGTITNTLLSEPRALLTWAQAQMSIFNHPRFNYTVSPMHNQIVGVGDSITVQDFHMKPMILVNSKVIQKTTSFSSPETNTFVLGEFSNIFTENANKGAGVTSLIKKDVKVVQEAADNARVAADEAHKKAVEAQQQAIKAQTSADGKATIFSVNSFGDLPATANEGDIAWVTLADGTHGYTYLKGKWVEDINPTMAKNITDGVDDAVTQAKAHVEEVKQGLSSDIATARSEAVSQANTAQQNAIDVASKSLGTYLVRLLPGTNIFKTTNTTTIQAQVWKAGQDITSTIATSAFTWTLAKDGGTASTFYTGKTSVTASPSDFTSTGVYVVKVVIPVTDTTGTTRNQTFADSITIAKVVDGTQGAKGADGIAGKDGVGIKSTSITYSTSTSGTTAPTSGYTSTIPNVAKGMFLWQRTTTILTDNTTKTSDIVTYFAKDGLNGNEGMDGGQGMIAQPTKPTSGLVDGFLWLDTSQTYPVYYVYDGSIKDFKIYQFNAKNINADQLKAKFVGTDRLSASQIIADELHVKSANIDGNLTASQITVSSTNGAQTSLAQFNLGEMSQTISDTKKAVNNLGQVNQLSNTEFTPDYQSWTGYDTTFVNDVYTKTYKGSNVVAINSKDTGYHYLWQYVPVIAGAVMSLSAYMHYNPTTPDNSTVFFRYQLVFYNDSNTSISQFFGTSNFQSLDWVLQKSENITVPTGATKVRVTFYSRGGGYAAIAQPMLVFALTVGTYVQGNYNNNAALAQVKITAEGISNFVKDTNGNLSSTFQTALGKTSIVTGSTLASSIQKQTATQITSALTDNNKNIISMINLDPSGAQIYGKNIVLDGNTTVTGTFKVSQANITNGAIGTAQIGDAAITSAKIANLDVSKLTGDTITGFNFNVNRSINITSGGIISSDIINMTKDDFVLKTNNINSSRTSPNKTKVSQTGTYTIDTQIGGSGASGTISTTSSGATSPYRTGTYFSQYNPENIYMMTSNYSNGDAPQHMNISSAGINISEGGAGINDDASLVTTLTPGGLSTQGFGYFNSWLKTDSGFTAAGNISGSSVNAGNLVLNGAHSLQSLDGGTIYVTDKNGGAVQLTASKLIAGTMGLNGSHSLISYDGGKIWVSTDNGNLVDLGVKSLSQSSLVSLKEHIDKVNPEQLLSETLRADIRSYNFTGDDITDKHVTPMIDDVNHEMYIPNDWLSPEGTGVDTYSIIGYLIGSVKALQEQITELKANQ